MTKQVKEGLADLADRAERDHEVQMARSDLYKLAKYAIKLHDMLKNVSEAQGIEGWQQAKITKAADYISSVYHAMDYDMQFAESVKKVPETAKAKRIKPTLTKEQYDTYKNRLRNRLNETLKVSDGIEAWIEDFVNSDDPKFDGKSREQRRQMAMGAFYAAKREGNK
jgi:enoyl reductase-like protein